MGTISRGFFGRRTEADVKLPPGQYLTTDFPVLSAGPAPHIPLEKWEFTIDDGTNLLRRWNWNGCGSFAFEVRAQSFNWIAGLRSVHAVRMKGDIDTPSGYLVGVRRCEPVLG